MSQLNKEICVSWFKLEQYNLNELRTQHKMEVENHISTCSKCNVAWNVIKNDTLVLKPLPFVEKKNNETWLYATALAALLLAALGLLLFTEVKEQPVMPSLPDSRILYKGDTIAVSLVRNRKGHVTSNSDIYAEGDVFKVLLTCPASIDAWDVVIFQGKGVYFPYDNKKAFKCGNLVPLPGAFSLSGEEDTTVCAILKDLPSRDLISQKGIDVLPGTTVCTKLHPEKQND